MRTGTSPDRLPALLAGSLLLALVGFPSDAVAAPAAVYASSAGSGNSCTQIEPCGLTQAQSLVRSMTAAMSADIEVHLAGGTYRLAEPLRFGPLDSGRNGHRVRWAADGGSPVFTGGLKVDAFAVHDAAKNIYRAAVPVGTKSRQLFVDGVRAQRARTALAPSGFSLSGSSFITADASYRAFTDQSQVEVVDNVDWKHLRCPLKDIRASGSGSSLNVDPTCFKNSNTNVPNLQYPFNGSGLPKLNGVSWIENAYQLLNQPGQFYLDSAGGSLYYIPRAGEDMSLADVELPVAESLVELAGTPGHLAPVNDDEAHATYSGPSWRVAAGRALGDHADDVHYATANGDSVSYTFTGTGLQVLSERNSDEGAIDVYVDGVKTTTVTANAASRAAQQAVVSVTGLAKGQHTLKLVKASGQYMLVDGFTVTPDVVEPVHDIAFEGITFSHTTWNLPTTTGYLDNQAGVLWDAATRLPVRIPAAVQVHRGKGITFTGNTFQDLGATALDLADGTQDSAVTGNLIDDVSGGGVSVGEVDDYYLEQPALMTSGITVSQNTITHVGQDYQDAVGVWAGYTRDVELSHNDIGYTSYSGISLGWGWGWATQMAGFTRHGTNYAGGNRILDNHVHNVMRVLEDGGPIYTLGGQNGNGTSTSELAGNVVEAGNHTNNMIYHDEGSSSWNTHDNVVRYGGEYWVGMWIKTIHDITIHDNFSDNTAYLNVGTHISFQKATAVTDGSWPVAARQIVAAAGPTDRCRPAVADTCAPAGGRIDDDHLAIAYHGAWSAPANRGLGDLEDGIHSTSKDGASATITFSGTSIAFSTETNTNEGLVRVTLDGVDKGIVDARSATRQAQKTLYRSGELTPGTHSLTLTKAGGSYLLIDRFDIG